MPANPTISTSGATADAVFTLLGNGLNDFDRNWEAAKASLSRAYAMLQAEREVSVPANNIARGGLAPWQKRKIEAFVTARLDVSISTAEMAREARLSPQHFSRAFRQSFGTSPHAYVISRRVAHAQHQMLTTSDTLSQIALDCGFADQAHFTRCFHRHLGAPPHAWRQRTLGSAGR
ncbi:HTH-type transcriptional activator RhaR [Alphaproteobacteria bacterium SO-S41]|nr:HTH-type transcriptional activator RhaR [Alphaproteobacteria bacterium SO-S41]